jgi:hypothetical protein
MGWRRTAQDRAALEASAACPGAGVCGCSGGARWDGGRELGGCWVISMHGRVNPRSQKRDLGHPAPGTKEFQFFILSFQMSDRTSKVDKFGKEKI